jgi:hypothetical protein
LKEYLWAESTIESKGGHFLVFNDPQGYCINNYCNVIFGSSGPGLLDIRDKKTQVGLFGQKIIDCKMASSVK